jgi:hypothetical protein
VTSRPGRLALLVALIAVAAPVTAWAQRMTLTVSNGPVTFPTPTATDFDAGYVVATNTLTVAVSVSTGKPSNTYGATVSFQATPANLGGTKALSDLEWQLNGGTWTATTVAPNSLPQRTVSRSSPSSDVLAFRMKLSYANDVPGSYGTNLTFTLTSP